MDSGLGRALTKVLDKSAFVPTSFACANENFGAIAAIEKIPMEIKAE